MTTQAAGRSRPRLPDRPLPPSGVTDRLGFRLSSLLAVALLPLGLIGLFQAGAWDRASREQAVDALIGESLRAAQPTLGLIREAQGAARALAQRVPSLLGDDAACDAAMTAVVAASPQYSVAGHVPGDGRMACASNGAEFDYGPTALFAQIRAEGFPDKVYVQERGPVSGVSVVVVTVPVGGERGAGYAVLAMPHSALTRAAEGGEGGPVEFVTFNADGVVLTTSRGFEEAAAVMPVGVDLGGLVGGGRDSFEAQTAAGEERLYAVVPLVDGALYAMGTVPVRAAAFAGAAGASPFLLTVMMWAGSLLVAWLAAERLVTRHVRRLGRAIGAFASGSRAVGDLDVAGAPAEIREVSNAFLLMTDTILHDEAELEDAVHQKEVLLREVHHRVKNNLQLIASIMNMQMRRARSPETKALMRGLQDRVMSLATVHKELYQTSGLVDVRADELLGDITRQVVAMASAPGRRFDVSTDFARLRLTPDQAVPLSLLLTEALTNAIKYAEAPDGRSSPRLRLSLVAEEGGQARLSVENSLRTGAAPGAVPPGPGPDGAAVGGLGARDGTGLGHQLIAAFASQLDGTIKAHTGRSDAGAQSYRVEVAFALAPLAGGEARRDGEAEPDAPGAAAPRVTTLARG